MLTQLRTAGLQINKMLNHSILPEILLNYLTDWMYLEEKFIL